MTRRKQTTEETEPTGPRRFVVRSPYPLNINGLRAVDGGNFPLLSEGDVIEVAELPDAEWECPAWLEATEDEPTVLSIQAQSAQEAVEPAEVADEVSTPDGAENPPSDPQGGTVPPQDPEL